MVSLHIETARSKSPGHKNELCFFRNTHWISWFNIIRKTIFVLYYDTSFFCKHTRFLQDLTFPRKYTIDHFEWFLKWQVTSSITLTSAKCNNVITARCKNFSVYFSLFWRQIQSCCLLVKCTKWNWKRDSWSQTHGERLVREEIQSWKEKVELGGNWRRVGAFIVDPSHCQHPSCLHRSISFDCAKTKFDENLGMILQIILKFSSTRQIFIALGSMDNGHASGEI